MWLELTEVCGTDFERPFEFDCAAKPLNNEHPTPRHTIPISVQFLTEKAVRLVLRPNPEVVGVDSSPLGLPYDEYSRDTNVDINSEDETVKLDTEGISASVATDTASFTLSYDNKRILDTNIDVTNNRGELSVPTIGYKENIVDNYPLEVVQTGFSTALDPAESIFGLGEQFTTFEKSGSRVEASVSQAHGTNSNDTYAPVPFFLSDRGYGVLVETACDVTFDFGSNTPDATAINVDSSVLSIVVFAGESLKDIISSYTALTGRAPELPEWTYGIWMSRNSYESQTQVRDIASEIRERSMPCDVLHVDPGWMDMEAPEMAFDAEEFPSPEKMKANLAEAGFRLSVWEYPYINTGTDLFRAAEQNDYLVTDHEGRSYILRRPSYSATRAGIIDFSNPEAISWWQEIHHELIESGIDVFKTDFGEYLPPQTTTADRRTGMGGKNIYSVAYQRAVAGAFEEFDKPPVLWSRSAWVGAQQYPIHWGGDTRSTFKGFRESVRGGLSLLISGFQFWSCDIGGYKPKPSETLYIRWAQWALLSLSHPRFHGKTPREPWMFGDRATKIIIEFAKLRYRLLPYYLSYGCEAIATGVAIMRPMALEFEDYQQVSASATQHMIGEEFLVAPVLSVDGQVKVDLPPGEWVDYWSGEYHVGPQRQRREPNLDELPFFVRAESIIPEDPRVRMHADGPPAELDYRVYPACEGKTTTQFTVRHPEVKNPDTIEVEIDESWQVMTVTTSDSLPPGTVIVEAAANPPNRVVVDDTELDSDEIQYDANERILTFDINSNTS